MIDYSGLQALVVVLKERSFTKAAETLFITQSAVSQRVKSLESAMGQPLLIRAPTIQPTEAGQHLLNHYQNIVLLEQELSEKCRFKADSAGGVRLSVAVNTESLANWFLKAVKDTLLQRKIFLNIRIEDQERTIEFLKAGKVWGCVTSKKYPPYGCTSTYLGKMVYHLVCTPEFYERYFKKGINGTSLLKAPRACWGENDYMQYDYLVSCFNKYKRGVPQSHFVPSPEGLVEVARSGIAFVLLPEIAVRDDLKTNRLVDLLPDKLFKLPLYFHTQELQTELTSKFAKEIVGHAQSLFG